MKAIDKTNAELWSAPLSTNNFSDFHPAALWLSETATAGDRRIIIKKRTHGTAPQIWSAPLSTNNVVDYHAAALWLVEAATVQRRTMMKKADSRKAPRIA